MSTDTMTTEEALKKATRGVLKQGKPSMNSTGACLYRLTERGGCPIKCSVGHLILNSVYCDALEGKTHKNPLVINALSKSGVPVDPQTIEYLGEIQMVHDVGTSKSQSFIEAFKGGIQRKVDSGLLPEYVLEVLDEEDWGDLG